MPLFGHCFLSDVLNKPVFDPNGEVAGRLADALIVKGDDVPLVSAVIVTRRGGTYRVPWSDVEVFNKRLLSVRRLADALDRYEPGGGDLLAVRDILDKQIVDTNGAKVVRVNDVRLEGRGGAAVLTAIDVGVRGLLRRLGVEHRSDAALALLKTQLPWNLIPWQVLQPLTPKVKAISLAVPWRVLGELHPADLADILRRVPREEGRRLFGDLDVKTAAGALPELPPDRQVELITAIDADKAADIIEEMPPDAASDVLGDLPVEKAKEILERVEAQEAEEIHELLAYEEDTAGGLMTTAFLAYPATATAGEAVERLKRDSTALRPVYHLYVLDAERLVGTLSLQDLLVANASQPLGAIMDAKPRTVAPETPETAVTTLMAKYNLVEVPVVDEQRSLLGVVTVDDILGRLLPAQKRGLR